MANLTQALPWVLQHEGGWSDDPVDPGGATNFGITLKVARRHGIATVDDLRQITDEKVAEIYRADYWRFDGVDDQAVATKLFDMVVNLGPRIGVKLLQESLNDIGASLDVDGFYGTATEMALNATRPDRLLDLLCQACAERYQHLVNGTPALGKFLHGWLVRAAEVPA